MFAGEILKTSRRKAIWAFKRAKECVCVCVCVCVAVGVCVCVC